MCTITATELKNNLGKYLLIGQSEDVLVTKNGKPLIILSSASKNALDNLLDLAGILENSNIDFDEARLEKLKK